MGRGTEAMRSILLLGVPALVFAGHRVELSALVHPRSEVVTNSISIAAEPDRVWANLRSFDSLTGRKPALMHIGLPVPVRCTVQANGKGSKPTCYFDQGSMEETVAKWQPPYRMGL